MRDPRSVQRGSRPRPRRAGCSPPADGSRVSGPRIHDAQGIRPRRGSERVDDPRRGSPCGAAVWPPCGWSPRSRSPRPRRCPSVQSHWHDGDDGDGDGYRSSPHHPLRSSPPVRRLRPPRWIPRRARRGMIRRRSPLQTPPRCWNHGDDAYHRGDDDACRGAPPRPRHSPPRVPPPHPQHPAPPRSPSRPLQHLQNPRQWRWPVSPRTRYVPRR